MVGTANDHLSEGETPYSDKLIELLENFEYPGLVMGAEDIEGIQVDDAGNEVPNHSAMPTPLWIADHMLPLARRRVQRYRGIYKRKPLDYFNRLDVSWTKPQQIMPLV